MLKEPLVSESIDREAEGRGGVCVGGICKQKMAQKGGLQNSAQDSKCASVVIMMLSQENRILTSAIPNSLELAAKDSSYLPKHSHFAD